MAVDHVSETQEFACPDDVTSANVQTRLGGEFLSIHVCHHHA